VQWLKDGDREIKVVRTRQSLTCHTFTEIGVLFTDHTGDTKQKELHTSLDTNRKTCDKLFGALGPENPFRGWNRGDHGRLQQRGKPRWSVAVFLAIN
jgi:hypothetical protein